MKPKALLIEDDQGFVEPFREALASQSYRAVVTIRVFRDLFVFLVIVFVGSPQAYGLIRSHNIVGLEDPRRPAELDKHPELYSVGRISTADNDIGTAFLIDPCYILTGRHPAFADFIHPTKNSKSFFKIGHDLQRKSFSEKMIATPISWGQDSWAGADPDVTNFDESEDWAVCRLQVCLDNRFIPLQLKSFSFDQINQKMLMNLSRAFAEDAAEILWDLNGNVRFEKNSVWFVDNASEKGDSGGPLFLEENGVYKVVAIMISQDLDSKGRVIQAVLPSSDKYFFNIAVSIKSILPRVLDAMEKDKILR